MDLNHARLPIPPRGRQKTEIIGEDGVKSKMREVCATLRRFNALAVPVAGVRVGAKQRLPGSIRLGKRKTRLICINRALNFGAHGGI